MKKQRNTLHLMLFASFSLLAVTSCKPVDREKYSEEGVSKFLALYRKESVSDVRYNLIFSVPGNKVDPVTASEKIDLELSSRRLPLLIDFRVPPEHLFSVAVNGRKAETVIENGHIALGKKHLRKGHNIIEITFRAGDLSLNRNEDYLYTLLVPDRASTAFPCLDQPDLKARFSLSLEMPSDYRAMSNGAQVSSDTSGNRVTVKFAPTEPISTYLFAFAAGRFSLVEKETGGMKMQMLHRETRTEYIDRNADEIFRLHLNSVRWLEDYTGIKYPFGKFGFVLIPSFQYSGMEHPGSIWYKASSLLLESSPTVNEQLSRASLIAHETSHLWFGDLVTMKWFDDVWLKEVFAGFMSDKIVSPDFPTVNHDLRFYISRFPAAYSVDRTAGSNPVIQKLDNLKDAGSLYGAIIYNKAPILMRQLEQITGVEGLRSGLREWLKEYQWGNATWDDLVGALEKASGKPLTEWSDVWFREPGMPVISFSSSRGGGETTLTVTERDPAGKGRHWPQTMKVMIITTNDTVTSVISTGLESNPVTVRDTVFAVIPDISGRAYGTFLTDSASSAFLPRNAETFSDPLIRGIIWVNLWENLVNGNADATALSEALSQASATEGDAQLRSYLTGRLGSLIWNYLDGDERLREAAHAETLAWEKMSSAASAADRRTWYSLFSNIAMTEDGLKKLMTVWETGVTPGGYSLSEDELTSLALNLALKMPSRSVEILDRQGGKITNPDRKARFEFVRKAVSHDEAERDAFFESLKDPSNREHEPWVLEALGYLHHPLRTGPSLKYIKPSLEMLEEIKSTGDIFFPSGWITATLSSYHSLEAKQVVKEFLDSNPGCPEDLRLKILQAADHLMRIE